MAVSKIDIANQLDLDLNDVGAVGTSYTMTYNGADTITLDPSIYNSSNITINNGSWNYTGTYNPTVNISNTGIDMQDGTDIKIGGKSLTETLEKLEERLNILHPNEKLEAHWEELRELGRKYRELEKDILEKEKLMKILKEK